MYETKGVEKDKTSKVCVVGGCICLSLVEIAIRFGQAHDSQSSSWFHV